VIPTSTRRTEPVPRHDDPLAQAAFCSVCPKLCRPACPVQRATGREAVAPWRISGAVVDGTTHGWTPDLATQVASCTGCLACATPCLPGTNLPEASRAARAAAADAGVPLPVAVRLRERIATTGTPRRWQPRGANGADRLFLGCPSSQEVADAALALGSFTVDANERCCGAAALDLGLAAEARDLATDCAASLGDADRVVVASPGCARMMRDEWPRYGLAAPPVVTAVEWLASVVPTRDDAAGPVTWHAPCVLARGLGVVDEPVAVLERLGYDVRQPVATGTDTRCSGAGAAYPLVDPAGAEAVGAARRAELAALDAPVVTACPSAARALGATDLLVLAAARLAR
jgi:Fe-S oxidoreductase